MPRSDITRDRGQYMERLAKRRVAQGEERLCRRLTLAALARVHAAPDPGDLHQHHAVLLRHRPKRARGPADHPSVRSYRGDAAVRGGPGEPVDSWADTVRGAEPPRLDPGRIADLQGSEGGPPANAGVTFHVVASHDPAGAGHGEQDGCTHDTRAHEVRGSSGAGWNRRLDVSSRAERRRDCPGSPGPFRRVHRVCMKYSRHRAGPACVRTNRVLPVPGEAARKQRVTLYPDAGRAIPRIRLRYIHLRPAPCQCRGEPLKMIRARQYC